MSRISAYRRGLPVAMRLLRRGGALVELEATVGGPPRGGPDASIERHRGWLARGPEQRVRLPRVKTGDVDLRRQAQRSRAGAAGRSGAARARAARGRGRVLSLWSGTAARYHVTSSDRLEGPPPFRGEIDGDAPVGKIVAVLDTLAELVEASAS